MPWAIPFSRRPGGGAAIPPLLVAALACCLLAPAAQAGIGRQVVQPMQSQPNADEVDTADRPNGQAGGQQLGRNYQLKALRCQGGEAIVGVRMRRGQVIDYLQVACARSTCTGGECQWGGLRWGPAAGNPLGGNRYPDLLCAPGEVVTGMRARIVTFTVFDYAADLELECTNLAAAPGAKGLGRSPASTWRGTGGGLDTGTLPGNAAGHEITGPISCLPNGEATAISTAESDFVQRGQRIVQAISLYCPKGPRAGNASASIDAILKGLDACLREESGIGFYTAPNIATYSGRATYDGAADTIYYDPTFLAGQSPYARAFWLAAAFGGHIVNLEKRIYGTTRTATQYIGERDVISGYLTHCLVIRNLLPRVTNMSEDDPRLQYDAFLAQGGFLLPGDPPGAQQYRADWEQGWRLQGMTLAPSILPRR